MINSSHLAKLYLLLLLSFVQPAFSYSSNESKGVVTYCVDAIEHFSERYINPVVYAFVGYKLLNDVANVFTAKNSTIITLKPNLSYSNPNHQQACDSFNAIAQKVDISCPIHIVKADGYYIQKGDILSTPDAIWFEQSLFNGESLDNKKQSQIAFHLTRIKNGNYMKAHATRCFGYPLLYGILKGSGALCKGLFKDFFKTEYTESNKYCLKDLQRLCKIILQSPLTLLALGTVIFNKTDSFFRNRTDAQVAQIMGPDYCK